MKDIPQKDRELLAARTYREFILNELTNRCTKKTLYSMRALARDLGVPVSSLSSALGGKAHLSRFNILKIAGNLNKVEPVTAYFKHLALAEIEAPGDRYNPHYLKAKEIRLRYLCAPVVLPHRMVNGWSLAPLALTILLDMEEEIRTDEALQKRLGVGAAEFKRIFDELESVGWVARSPEGACAKIRHAELGGRGEAYEIRSLQRKTLERALWSLDQLPYEQRNFHNVLFPMFPEQATKLAEQMKACALSMAEEQGPPQRGQEVYVLGNFLLPLTRQPVGPT